MIVEVCVDNLASVEAAARAGADRIELCAGLVEGGTTPSLAFLNAARRIFPGKIMAMLRPRAGDFLYSEAEFEMMLHEVGYFRREGADGIVFGMLRPDGTIDVGRTRILMEKAAGLDLTFHRAFDLTRSPKEALETLIALGIPRVLTSGCEPDVARGIEAIAGFVRHAAGRIAVMPGGGVEPSDVAEIVRRAGVTEIHLAALETSASPMLHRRHDIPMGAAAVPGEYQRVAASEEKIRQAVAALRPPVREREARKGLIGSLGRTLRGLFGG